MSKIKNGIAAGIVAAGLGASWSPATAQECDQKFIDAGDVAKTLLATPRNEWNKEALASLTQDTRNNVITAFKEEAEDAFDLERTFKNFQKQQDRGRLESSDIEKEASKAHPAIRPILENLKTEFSKGAIGKAQTQVIETGASYIRDSVAELRDVKTKNPFCLTGPTGPQ